MILYGGLTNTSVGHLFIAGVVPGIALALMFMAYTAVWNLRVSGLYPRLSEASATGERRWYLTVRAIPAILICVVILGSIYAGVATPTEAAAVGVAGALLLSLIKRRLTAKVLHDSLMGAMHTTSMALLLLVGCQILTYAFNHQGVPQQVSELMLATFDTKWLALPIIFAMYLGLGLFIDGLSMMILTTPIVYPIVVGYGLSPIWFGVVMTICIEMSLITPPVGMNLYILHGLDRESHFGEIARGCMPYVGLMIVMLLLLLAFPSIATWLPGTMR
jgi:tripartite ATP-independent transporter DctM subunit